MPLPRGFVLLGLLFISSSSIVLAQDADTELNNQGVLKAQAGEFEEAVNLLHQAMELQPNDASIRKNLSGVLTDWSIVLRRNGKSQESLSALEEAVELDPDNGSALALLGNHAYLTFSDISKAIGFWEKAYPKLTAVQGQALVRQISRAKRDLLIERSFVGVEIPHFQIRFEGHEHEESAQVFGAILEQQYELLSKKMAQSPGPLSVIVYTQGNFERMAGRYDWALGLYDGRIRLRLEDLHRPYLTSILAHELTHAFLSEAYGPDLPVWIHEGFAQLMETPSPLGPHQKAVLEAVVSRQDWVPLKWLDRHFEQPSGPEDLERAYLQAKVTVEFLVGQGGLDSFKKFLNHLSKKRGVEFAFQRAYPKLQWQRVDHGIL